MKPFDVGGPLPKGVTVLDASAGTGKTFTIAALAARYVADGVPLDELLLVTFTRMATGELRHRVRERLVSAEHGLGRLLAGGEVAPGDAADDVLAVLATGTAEEVAVRRARLRRALSAFDAATIDTTHAFCQRVLTGLGVAGDVDGDATFIEDSRDVMEEVVSDFYLRKFARGGVVEFTLDEARRMARQVTANPDAEIHPPATGDAATDVRRSFAEAVRHEVDRRRRDAAVLTFDDLLTRLRDTLAHPQQGPAACARLRERYKVVLVDEFQDTDPIQWDIMRRAFVDDGAEATLVLIGDPKQAIYAFRGADVYAYLDAVGHAREQATLEVNWRSDQALLDTYDALFDGVRLGHEGIVYRSVRAAGANQDRRLRASPCDAPLRVRVLHRGDGLVSLTPKGYLSAAGARHVVAADLAGDIVGLLSSGAEIPAPDGRAAPVPVGPGDVAVLVQRNADAMAVRDALDAAGVPAVVNGAGSVFATPAARDWLRLLAALERPSALNPVRTLALSSFLGWTPERVATAGDDEWEGVHARVHQWAGLVRRRGVATLFETISMREHLSGRLLARPQGERQLTDLRHVAQLLHAEVTAEHLGITALTEWLRTRIGTADDDAAAEDRSRRLESDAQAVQVLTIYRSKGLEFPVVYCPFLWHPGWIEVSDPPVFHDTTADGRRTVDVSGLRKSPAQDRRLVEERGEELRLAYVALTRAKHQAVVWWAPTWDSRDSSLCRLLFGRDDLGNVAAACAAPPPDAAAVARFEELAERAPGLVSVERAGGGDGVVLAPVPRAPADLSASSFTRPLDPRWRRTSYSALTSSAHEARVESEAEEPILADEEPPEGADRPGDPVGEDGAEEDRLRSVSLPLGAMRGGADVGTFVHGVLERCDFAADDLDAALAAAFAAESARAFVDVGDEAPVLAGLRAAVDTPLGPLVDGLRLRDIARRDRVDELGFELPLVGGDAPTSTLWVPSIGVVVARHLAPDDVVRPYAERLQDPTLHREVRGYLSGSLDLVARTPDGRYLIVDYKTNRLGPGDAELTAWHYRPAALIAGMFESHYPLQALLYTVALHRYLRWRLPGYSAERHLAGVAYLFVRGMIGPSTPVVDGQPCGVFAWRPPAALVEALSDLFDTGSEAA